MRSRWRTTHSVDSDWVRDAGEENTIDNFAYVFDKKLEELVLNRMDRNSTQAVKFLDSPDVREFVTQLLRNRVYDRIQAEKAHAPGRRA
jgi:type I restriction enzyme, R subunit